MVDKVMMYVVAGLLVLFVVFGLYHFSRVAFYKLEITNLEVKLAERDKDILTLTSSLEMTIEANKTLELSLKTQNDQINAWVAEAEQRKVNAEKALATARASAETWRKKYTKLLESPPDSIDQCKSLEIRLDHYLTLRSEP